MKISKGNAKGNVNLHCQSASARIARGEQQKVFNSAVDDMQNTQQASTKLTPPVSIGIYFVVSLSALVPCLPHSSGLRLQSLTFSLKEKRKGQERKGNTPT
jgi:hypothetical protein